MEYPKLPAAAALDANGWPLYTPEQMHGYALECMRTAVQQPDGPMRDAARWRAMRQCLLAVDWAYGEPQTSIAAFELHSGCVMAGPEGADAIADAAIAAKA